MNSLYCIMYDLIKEKDYSTLIDEIKRFPSWWHQTGSVWFVVSSETSVQIRDKLRPYIDVDDKIFVIRVYCNNWAGYGFSKEEYDWIRNRVKELEND